MKFLLRQLLTHSVSPVLRARLKQQPCILMFHGFTDRPHSGCENSQHKHLHVEKLKTFLQFLKRHYQIISLNELTRCLSMQEPPPEGSVVLTFDDGFASCHQLAYPLLQCYEAPATIYLATEFVDQNTPIWTDRVDYLFHAAGLQPKEMWALKQRLKKLPSADIEPVVCELEQLHGIALTRSNRPEIPAIYHSLTWDQVREMQDSGLVNFGAHTHTHKILGHCDAATIGTELATSKQLIERETLRPCEHFCYPNGGQGDFSPASEQLVKEAGFKTSVTTLTGWVDSYQGTYLLPRLGVTNDLDLARFDLMLSGFNAGMQRLRNLGN